MTAQLSDGFLFEEIDYSIAGISGGELFDPKTLDLEPSMASTACWRGYQVIYSLNSNHLVAKDLRINLLKTGDEEFRRVVGPAINDVAPTPPGVRFNFFNNHYEGIDYHLEYSGGLLLANGFIDDLYVHMGFHAPWKYENVIELLFENGVLVDRFDRSAKMSEVRDTVLNQNKRKFAKMPTVEEISRFVAQAFDRSYGQ